MYIIIYSSICIITFTTCTICDQINILLLLLLLLLLCIVHLATCLRIVFLFSALLGSASANGFQMVITGSQAKPLNDFQMVNIQVGSSSSSSIQYRTLCSALRTGIYTSSPEPHECHGNGNGKGSSAMMRPEEAGADPASLRLNSTTNYVPSPLAPRPSPLTPRPSPLAHFPHIKVRHEE